MDNDLKNGDPVINALYQKQPPNTTPKDTDFEKYVVPPNSICMFWLFEEHVTRESPHITGDNGPDDVKL